MKFYEDGNSAITAVAQELVEHTKTDYLRNEFMLITNKLDTESPHFKKLSQLLDPNTSLDTVFDVACIPIFITYESNAVRSSTKSDDAYKAKLVAEVTSLHKKFRDKIPDGMPPIRIHLFFLPLHTKTVLIKRLDELLKEWQ